jgi:hypothetical protein
MIDKTTVGVTAEPEEVEAALRNLCGYHLAEPDPLFRYTVLTREQVLYDALVAAIKRERGRALAELAASGQKLTQIADATNLTSRQQVQRLIALAKAAEAAAAEVQAASREFEDRLAAVEATLDEVVSGLPPALLEGDVVSVRLDAIDSGPVEPDLAGGALAGAVAVGVGRLSEDLVGGEFAGEDLLGEDFAGRDGEPRTLSVATVPVPALEAEMDDSSVFLEPTQFMPALRGILHPTKEMPPSTEEVPWWRRGREAREARDPGAA